MGTFFNRLPRGVLASLAAIPLALASTSLASAQDSIDYESRPPIHVRAVDGEARLERDGQSDPLPVGMPIVEGDVLSTSGGRVELQTGGGSILDIDEFSAVDVLDDQSFRLREGRVALIASPDDPTARGGYRLETPDGLVTTAGPGEYQVAAGTRQRESSARFSRWVDDRRRERADAAASRQFLPSELGPYADTFDRYGSWTVEPGYGYVWSPRVEVAWQPYYVGYWSPIGRYGLTWISGDPWGWPTHHYGRWHYVRNRWAWSAGRAWSPAWVTWGTSADYISWCPVGIRSPWVAGYASGPFSASFGWVVVPQDYFRTRRALVARYAVPPHRLDRRTPFVEHAQAPFAASATPQDRRYAVGRQSAPAFVQRGAGSAERARPVDNAAGDAPRTGRSGYPEVSGNSRAARRWPDRPSTSSTPFGPSAPPAAASVPSLPRTEARDGEFRRRFEAHPQAPTPPPPAPPPQPRAERGAASDRGAHAPMRHPPSSADGGGRGAAVPRGGAGEHPGAGGSPASHGSRGSQDSGGHGAVRRPGR